MGFDLAQKQVFLEKNTLEYDYLVLALGGQTGYFGHPEWEQFAPGLKTLDDALRIRSRVLLAFEKAENEPDAAERERLMTIVIIGGGQTGVELAGAFAELARTVLKRDFRRIDPTQARILLIEGSPVCAFKFSAGIVRKRPPPARRPGREVRASTRVENLRENEVELDSGEILRAGNILWAAGVSATALTKARRRTGQGRARESDPDLNVPGHPEIFAIGDMALVLNADGTLIPGVSPAAMQMGRHVARNIESEIRFGAGHALRPPFRLGQRNHGHHWPVGSGGVDWQTQNFRIDRVAGMAVRPSAFSDWFSQQTRCVAAMDLFVFRLQTQRPHHHLPAARNGK